MSLEILSFDYPATVKALLHAREGVMRQFRPALKTRGLTDQQWRVLSELAVRTEISASDLAAETCLRASSLSRIIKDLEDRGHIARRNPMEDMRRIMVSITPSGRWMMNDLSETIGDIRHMIEKRFGNQRLQVLHEAAWSLAQTLDCGSDNEEKGE